MNDVNRMNRKVMEELKAMGRMDGDGIDAAGEARTIEGWRQECERLRDKAAQLEALLANVRQGEMEKITEIKRLRQQIREHEAKHEAVRDCSGENEALRIIIRHLAKLL